MADDSDGVVQSHTTSSRPAPSSDSHWIALFTLCDRPLPTQAQWLDLLPDELNLRIAKLLVEDCASHRQTRYVSPLQLADTSVRQRQMVKRALDYNVVLEDEDDFAIRVAGLMREDVRGLRCENWKGPQEVMMMLLGRVERLSVKLSAGVVERMGAVRKLEVVLGKEVAFGRMESVEELKVWGRVRRGVVEGVVGSFPNLRRLELVGGGVGENVGKLEGLGKLRVLRTDLEMREEDVGFLRGLDEVEVVSYGSGGLGNVSDAVLERNLVTGVELACGRRMCFGGLSFDAVERLAFCLRLTRLEIAVCAGDESLMPTLPMLKRLVLKWNVSNVRHDVDNAFVSRLVQTSSQLAHVELCNAQLSLANVQMLLQRLSLRAFAVSLHLPRSWQPVWHLDQILEMICNYRPQLNVFVFYPMNMRLAQDRASCKYDEWSRGLQEMVDVLQRTTELSNATDLKDRIRRWCSCAWQRNHIVFRDLLQVPSYMQ